MGNTIGQTLSAKIGEALNGTNLCSNLGDISDEFGAAVDYVSYNGQSGLLVSDPQGRQYVIVAPRSQVSKINVQCTATPINSPQVTSPPSYQALPPVRSANVNTPVSRNTGFVVGAARKFRMA